MSESDLRDLAPGVDVEASLTLFERRRRRDRRSRRTAQAVVAVVALVVVGAIGMSGRDVPRGDHVAGPAPSPWGLVSVTLDVELGGEYGSVRLFEDPAFWQGAIGDQRAPAVDFRHWVVVALTNDVMRCGAHLSGFERDGQTLTPAFAPGPLNGPSEGPWLCTLAAHPDTHVAAVWRADLEPSFTVRVPEGPYVGPETMHSFVVEATRTHTAEADSAIGFEIVDVRRAPPARAGDIRLIDDEATLRDTWAELGLGQPQTVPSLDLDEQLVLMLTTSRGACEPELDGFALSGSTLEPVFRPIDDVTCGHEATTHTFVVALARATVAEIDSIALDGDDRLGIEPSRLDLVARVGN